jgi:hypothetical protein
MTAPPTAARPDVRAIVDQLRRDGWDVTTDPPVELIPEQLRSYQPDMIASRGDERLFVEVKTLSSRAELSGDLSGLAELIKQVPHWQLQVYWLGEDVTPESAAVLRSRARRAEALADNDPEAALMLAWSAIEGQLARQAAKTGEKPRWLGSALLGELTSRGSINDDEYQLLRDAQLTRSRIAHGRASGEVDPALVRALLDLIFSGRLAESAEDKAAEG